jgi:TusA-related sulfurtransferase
MSEVIELELDVVGERCPIPVQRIRKLLREIEGHAIITVIGDDPESLHDIPALLERLGLPPALITKMDKGWLYAITKPEVGP